MFLVFVCFFFNGHCFSRCLPMGIHHQKKQHPVAPKIGLGRGEEEELIEVEDELGGYCVWFAGLPVCPRDAGQWKRSEARRNGDKTQAN